MAANRPDACDGDIDVTLINPRPQFVERIRLHQLVAGTDDAVVDYADVLGEDVRLVVDTADAHRRRRAHRDAGLRRRRWTTTT